ncbi:hypothetical protein BC830DRAFT_1220889, partial [Chytriomyces sp. MP71]
HKLSDCRWRRQTKAATRHFLQNSEEGFNQVSTFFHEQFGESQTIQAINFPRRHRLTCLIPSFHTHPTHEPIEISVPLDKLLRPPPATPQRQTLTDRGYKDGRQTPPQGQRPHQVPRPCRPLHPNEWYRVPRREQ